MDNGNNKPPDDEQRSNTQNILHLPDGQVGETGTDEPIPRHVCFEIPSSTSWQSTLECQNLDEIKALVREMIESILPSSEPDRDASIATLTSPTTTSVSYDDERLHRILRLLDRYTCNLEAIEEQVLNATRKVHTRRDKDRLGLQVECNMDHQLTQHCELATQTLPLNTLRSNPPQQEEQRQQQQEEDQHVMELIPPCERRHHIITISANSSLPFVSPPPPRTFMGRIGDTFGNLAGALCLCLRVNKDCIFCLGFFLAFVISASFLTAFFYRTINLTATPIRVPIDSVRATPMPSGSETATLRFNGGYYYIYNTHRQHFV